jgi:hypothetical protein
MIESTAHDPLIHAAGAFAIISGIISVFGIILLTTMFVLFATPYKTQALLFGLLNDILVGVQYLLTIPVALALYRILQPYNPRLVLAATIMGIAAMVIIVILQLALVFEVLTFQQQGAWVTLALLVGVGSWLIITGLVERTLLEFPHSVLMSAVAVPYLGYPLWAYWLGSRLLAW